VRNQRRALIVVHCTPELSTLLKQGLLSIQHESLRAITLGRRYFNFFTVP